MNGCRGEPLDFNGTNTLLLYHVVLAAMDFQILKSFLLVVVVFDVYIYIFF